MVASAIPSWVVDPSIRVRLDRPCFWCFVRIHGRVFPSTATGGRMAMHGVLSDGFSVSLMVDTDG